MKLTAIYKTFDGGEWIDASLASIYDEVDAIVMVHSATSWLGESGNDVEAPDREWALNHDRAGKIHHVNATLGRQEQQYAAGLAYIAEHGLPSELILAVDSDEVWEPGHLTRARQQAEAVKAPAYQAQMHTYLRTPFYRVEPPFGRPVSLFRDPSWLTTCPRGCKAPAAPLANCWFHHFTYVRASDEAVARKLRQSCAADGGEQLVPDWMDTVWPILPHGENLHAFRKWQRVWQRINRVYFADLPAPIRHAHIMRRFWPTGLLMDGERDTLHDISQGRKIAVDLGTFRGLSAIVLSLGADHVHTVDLFERVAGDSSINEEYHKLFLDHGQTEASVRKTLGQYGNITVHASETAAASLEFADQSVDFLFVDADHTHEGTRRNWVSWWPKLMLGAWLVFHDDNPLHPGVQQAVRELDGNHIVRRVPLGPYAGSLAAFEKVSHA